MSELRPCPFCGSENLVLWQSYSEGYVVCRDCMAGGPKVEKDNTKSQARERMAVRLWNARATDDVMLNAADEIEAIKDPCLQWLVGLLREEAGR